MSDTKVYTRTTCQRCGLVNEREGAEADYPPVGWALISITYRGDGNGFSVPSHKPPTKGHFCPACAAEIAATASPWLEEARV